MATAVLVILSLAIRDVVGSNSFDHVPEECRAKHSHPSMYDYDEGKFEFDHSQLMTDVLDDFLELDLLSFNVTLDEFCSWEFPSYFNRIKRVICYQHSTRVCEDENRDEVLNYTDYYYDCYYYSTSYSPEPKSIYWFLVNAVEVMENTFESWKEHNACEDVKSRRYRGPSDEQYFYSDLERFLNDIKYNVLKGGYSRYGMINIETLLWKMLKHKFRNSDIEGKVLDAAIETIFDSSSVELQKLFEVFLQNPSKESKLLLKMVLTEYISKSFTKRNWNENYKCYLYQCESYLMYCSKKEFALLDIILGPEKEGYKTVVQMVVERIDDLLGNYGPFPYIELFYELVEQFDDIKHDLVNIHHQNILKMKNFMERRAWYELYSDMSNRSHEIEEIVLKNIACLGEENPVSLFMKNIQSEISREVFDLSVKQLKVTAKELLTKFRGQLRYVGQATLEYIMNILNCDDWTDLFTVDSNESLQLTNYLKKNKDGLRNFANLRLKASHLKAIQKTFVSLIEDSKRFVHSQAEIQVEIFRPLWQEITLTSDEREIVQSVLIEIGDAITDIVNALMSDYIP